MGHGELVIAALGLCLVLAQVADAAERELSFCKGYTEAPEGRCSAEDDSAIQKEYDAIVNRREALLEPMATTCKEKLQRFLCNQCGALDALALSTAVDTGTPPLWYMCKGNCMGGGVNARCETKQLLHWLPGFNFRVCC
mmetsp:Transcript_11507/g.36381  ORF Transcript_11507/g.36381 Transcript_11507/m.36381 type:complete len:139 (-) Transcript_11507:77-493(-)